MKNKIFFWVLLSAFTGISNLYAQQLKTLMGETVSYSKTHYFSFAGYDDANFYLLEFDKNKSGVRADITAFNRRTMKKIFSKPVVVPDFNGDKFSLNEILFSEDRILIFYSFYSKEDKLQQLMATYYATDGTPSGKAVEVFRASGKTKAKSGHFRVTSSDNRKYFLVWHHPSAYGLGENMFGEYTVEILNTDLETLYEKESMLEKYSADLKRIMIHNNGNAYIFGHQLGRGKEEENFIKFISHGTKTEKQVGIGGKFKIKTFAAGSDFYVDDKGTVYFIGLYSLTYDENKTKGIYIARLQEDGSIKNDAIIPYTLTDDKKPKSDKKNVTKEYYSIRDVKFREGNISILSCKNWIVAGNTDITTVKFGEGMFQYTVDYNFNMLNETFVSRNQTGAKEEKEMAFDIPFFNSEASYLLFNDTKENMESENPEVKAIKKFTGKAIAQLVSFKPDGRFIKEPLFTEQSLSKRLLIPERYLKMDKNEVVILTKLGEGYKLCKVFLE